MAAAISASVLHETTVRQEPSSTSASLKLRNLLKKIYMRAQLLPLRLSPEQIGPQDYGDVAGGHLIDLTVLSQSGQKLHQIPATEAQIALKTSCRYSEWTGPKLLGF